MQIFDLIDKYDLYGQIAYPKYHRRDQIASIYRWAAELKGLFVNPALTEPFGLTLLEAAACGLPIIAPDDGGVRTRSGAPIFLTSISTVESLTHAHDKIKNSNYWSWRSRSRNSFYAPRFWYRKYGCA